MSFSKRITFNGCKDVLLVLIKEVGIFKTLAFAAVTIYIIPLLASINTSAQYAFMYPEMRVGITYGESLILVMITAMAIFAVTIWWVYYIDLIIATTVRLFGECGEQQNLAEGAP